MRRESPTHQEARRWLAKAWDDLRACDVDLAASPPLLEDALYHCQQAVEKALKGFLVWYAQPFRRTHDIAELAALCVELDSGLEGSIAPAAPLTEYSSAFRYPSAREKPSRIEAENARGIAAHVLDTIDARLSSGTDQLDILSDI
jgi:HEPN domain-containing protein